MQTFQTKEKAMKFFILALRGSHMKEARRPSSAQESLSGAQGVVTEAVGGGGGDLERRDQHCVL